MGKIRRKFEAAFKQKIVQEIDSGKMSVNGAARAHQLSPSLIHYWQKQFRGGVLVDGPSAREKALEKENKKLKETLGELYLQVEILKKVEDWKRRLKSADSSIVTGNNLRAFVKGAE